MISEHKINVARSAAVHTTHLRLARRFAGQTVVAITHAGFVVASILAAFDIPRPGRGARLEPVHTSLTEWRVSAASWTFARYNDASHLLHIGRGNRPVAAIPR